MPQLPRAIGNAHSDEILHRRSAGKPLADRALSRLLKAS